MQSIDHASPTSDSVSPDTRYSAYIEVYNSLDSLIWRNMATLLGVTVLGAGIMGALLEHPNIKLVFLTHGQTVGLAFFLVSVFYGVTVYVIRRMRMHHELIESYLAEFEKRGYFAFRVAKSAESSKLSATYLVQLTFGVLAVLCLIASGIYIWTANG